MSEEFNLTFNEGDPVDAKKLQKLLEFINTVNATAMKLPTVSDIADNVVSSVMTMGKTEEYITLEFSGKEVQKRIDFQRALTSPPYSVIVTLESPSTDLDIVHYIKNTDQNGFTIAFNRVAGTNEIGVIQGTAQTRSVRVHYFAIATPQL